MCINSYLSKMRRRRSDNEWLVNNFSLLSPHFFGFLYSIFLRNMTRTNNEDQRGSREVFCPISLFLSLFSFLHSDARYFVLVEPQCIAQRISLSSPRNERDFHAPRWLLKQTLHSLAFAFSALLKLIRLFSFFFFFKHTQTSCNWWFTTI